MITFKKDKLLAARNKGQIKDKGKKAMDVVAVARKFQGRGDIKDAFVFAMQDLKKMVGKLSDAQKKKIFDEGGNFVNLEIIYPPTKNIIDYDKMIVKGTKRENLTIPHPEMHKRNFVLLPLFEIAKTWIHPLKKASIKDLINALDTEDLRTIKLI